MWTTEVRLRSHDGITAVVSYGRGGRGVRYPRMRREGPDSVTLISSLQPDLSQPRVVAGTQFQLDDTGALRMTYLRFGATAEFVLAGERSVDLERARALSGCGGGARGCVAALQTCVSPCARCVRGCDCWGKTQ
jgi:hypothetical protein